MLLRTSQAAAVACDETDGINVFQGVFAGERIF